MQSDNDQAAKSEPIVAIEADEWEQKVEEIHRAILSAKACGREMQGRISLLLTPEDVAENDDSKREEGENKTPLLNALDEIVLEMDDLFSQLVTLKNRICL